MTYLEQHRDEIFKKYSEEELSKDVDNYVSGKGRLTKFINQFFEECIFNCKDNRLKLTPMQAFQRDDILDKVRSLFKNSPKLYTGSEIENIKKHFSLGWIGSRKVANFCPRNARTIYQRYFKDLNGLNILDTSCGFGSRMLATILNGANYYGFDPNKELYGCLQNCHKWLVDHNKVPADRVCDIHCCGSEEHIPELDGKMDLSFTSPPYFNVETYSDDNGASTRNLDNYEGWLCEFVAPTLVNTYKYLKVGGLAMINIKNLTRGQKKPLYDDFMRGFQAIPGLEYVETFSMKHQHKRTLKEDMTYVGFEEPVMVYKKVRDNDVDLEVVKKALLSGIDTSKPARKRKTPDSSGSKAAKTESRKNKPYQLIIDDISDIDPRTLGKLMIELKNKGIEVAVVHGDEWLYKNPNIVYKLCQGLEIPLSKLKNLDGSMVEKYMGRNKLVRLQPGEKATFEQIPPLLFA